MYKDEKTYLEGIPWQSSGWESALSLPRAWVQSLVGELKSHKPRSTAKKEKTYWKQDKLTRH